MTKKKEMTGRKARFNNCLICPCTPFYRFTARKSILDLRHCPKQKQFRTQAFHQTETFQNSGVSPNRNISEHRRFTKQKHFRTQAFHQTETFQNSGVSPNRNISENRHCAKQKHLGPQALRQTEHFNPQALR
jgi:hypothetical protein